MSNTSNKSTNYAAKEAKLERYMARLQHFTSSVEEEFDEYSDVMPNGHIDPIYAAGEGRMSQRSWQDKESFHAYH